LDINTTDEGIGLLRKELEWELPFDNKWMNLWLEELMMPMGGHILVTYLNAFIAADAPIHGFKLLEPILDRSRGIY